MKNFLLIVATMCAATFAFTDTAVAGGGGKGKSKVVVSNINPAGGNSMTVWLLDDNEANQLSQPGVTIGDALRLPNKNIQPGNVDTFTENNGFYTIVVGDTNIVRDPANAGVSCFRGWCSHAKV